MSEMTASDVALMNGGGWNNWMNNPFLYLIFLRMFSPDGYGYNAAAQGALTRAELTDGLNNQTMQRDVANIREAVGNVGLMVQGAGSGISDKLCNGFGSVNMGIAENRFAAQQCCCETNRNIDAVRYENSKNTYEITNAIHAEGEATRALINANTIQELRDKLEARDREVLVRDFQLSQLAQNQYLVNEIRPCAKPAYITCSPYTTASFCGNGFGV